MTSDKDMKIENSSVEQVRNEPSRDDSEQDPALKHFEQAFERFASSTRQVRVASLDVFKPKKEQAEK